MLSLAYKALSAPAPAPFYSLPAHLHPHSHPGFYTCSALLLQCPISTCYLANYYLRLSSGTAIQASHSWALSRTLRPHTTRSATVLLTLCSGHRLQAWFLQCLEVSAPLALCLVKKCVCWTEMVN